MPYTKHNFQSGDILRAAELNDIDNQIYELTEAVEDATPGTLDYADLVNKPQIAGVTLAGNKSLSDLGIATESDVEALEDEVVDLEGSTNSKAPVINRDASGDVAIISDGADGMPLKSCSVDINLTQDLHGEAYPFPAEASANMIPNGTNTSNGYVSGKYIAKDGVAKNSSGNYISEWFDVLPDTQYVYSAKTSQTVAAICFFDSSKNYISGVNFSEDGTETLIAVTTPSNAAYARATQAYANTDLLQFEAGTSGTEIKPYSNICPITGFNTCSIFRTGQNIYDYIAGATGSNYYTLSDGIVTIDRAYGTGGVTMYGFHLYGLMGKTVTVSADVKQSKDSDDDRNTVRIGFKSGSAAGAYGHWYEATLSAYDTWERISCTLTLETYNEWKLGIQPRMAGHTLQFKNVQVEFGSVAHDYVPYSGQAYTVDWQTDVGTVYEGTVDPVSGELTVTMAGMIIDGTEKQVSEINQAASDSEYVNIRNKFTVLLADLPNNIPYNAGIQKCSHFLWKNYTGRKGVYPDQIYFSGSNRNVRWASSTFTTLDEFNAYLVAQNAAGTPVTLVYPLPAPLTYQLDPVQITTILGGNRIWSDVGAISLTYPADTQTYIDNGSNEAWAQINTLTNEVSAATPQIDFPEEISVEAVNNRTIRMVKNTIRQTTGGTANTTYRYCVFCKDRVISNTTGIGVALESVESTDFFTLPQTNGVYRIKLYVALRTYDEAPHTPPRFYVCYPDTDSIKYVRIDTLETGPDGFDGMYCVDLPVGTEKFVLGVTSRHSLCTFTAIYNVEYVPNADSNIETVSGTTPIITGESGKRYVCGTVDSISITPPSTGIIDVIFNSGTTAAVLTIPNTVKFPAWFDPSSLDASTTYEINIQDGVYGAVMAWT